ncbi:hypothetical protein [Anoxynatronum buryatiense]|uniref:Uncharacterized protein n=1 Tax=Anoxynatronum buryatiense TaxID=489973 RepID=A0AA46AK22_9CLOT|nr:hypothetical protein [Anoxynatronum buryatiense]SMP65639.1 hypothetical protein SAMN06296020_11313 [Anoxynatronum buryatiense]
MKKVLQVAAVSLLVVGLSASMAFADTPGRGNANGAQLRDMTSSVEERLNFKLERIDELVNLGRLTEAQAVEFKALITERMENCTSDAIGQNVKDPLSIGFGRTNEKGFMRGAGNHLNR